MTVSNRKNPNDEEIIKLCEKEHTFLRQELSHLKECQVRYLTFSITTTGIILGFVGKYGTSSSSSDPNLTIGLLGLLPLVVVLPSWWIFFDKAASITREVGYFRCIEKLMLGQFITNKFFGWENALREFRRLPVADNVGLLDRVSALTQIHRFFTLYFPPRTYRYWSIVNDAFICLSVLCCVAAGWNCFATGWKWKDFGVIAFAGFSVLFAWFWNTRILYKLVWGECSYNSNENTWKSILDIHPVPLGCGVIGDVIL